MCRYNNKKKKKIDFDTLLAEFSTAEADDETEKSKRFSDFKAQDNPLLTDDIADLRKWYMLK